MSCHTFCRYCTCHWIPPPSPQHQRWGCLPVSAGNSSLCSYPLLLPRSRGPKPPQSLPCPGGRSSTSQAQWCFEHLPHHVHLQNNTENTLNIWYDKTKEEIMNQKWHFYESKYLPVASKAFMICLSENPISSSGTAMAGGGGDVERRLLGSDNAWSE